VIAIRPLRRDDVAAAIQVLLGGTFSPEAEDATQEERYWSAAVGVQSNGGVVLVADDDGEVIGLCQVLILHHFQHTGGKTAEVESVHVRSDRRSQGIGAQLIAAAESHAESLGCYRIQLTSNNKRTDAHRFYLRLGYSQSHLGFKRPLPR